MDSLDERANNFAHVNVSNTQDIPSFIGSPARQPVFTPVTSCLSNSFEPSDWSVTLNDNYDNIC